MASAPGARPQPSQKLALDPHESFGYLLREAHRAVSLRLNTHIQEYGVSQGMWWFLRALWAEDGLTQIELSKRVHVKQPTTVRAMDSMEAKGFIERRKGDGDQRKVHIHLTPKGWALAEELLPYAMTLNGQIASHLSEGEREQFKIMLQKIVGGMQ